jgi:hypothetical protein
VISEFELVYELCNIFCEASFLKMIASLKKIKPQRIAPLRRKTGLGKNKYTLSPRPYCPLSTSSTAAIATFSTIAAALPRPTTNIAATATTARHIPGMLSLLLSSICCCQHWRWHFYYCCCRCRCRRHCCFRCRCRCGRCRHPSQDPQKVLIEIYCIKSCLLDLDPL